MGWLRRGVLLLLTPVHRWTGTALARLAQDAQVEAEGGEADLHVRQAAAEGLGPPAPPEHWLKLVGRAPAGAPRRPRAARAPAPVALPADGTTAAATSAASRTAAVAGASTGAAQSRNRNERSDDPAIVPVMTATPAPVPSSGSAPDLRAPLDALVRLPSPRRATAAAVTDADHPHIPPAMTPHSPTSAPSARGRTDQRTSPIIPDPSSNNRASAPILTAPAPPASAPASAEPVGDARAVQPRDAAPPPPRTSTLVRGTIPTPRADAPGPLEETPSPAGSQAATHRAIASDATTPTRSGPTVPDALPRAITVQDPRSAMVDPRPPQAAPFPAAPTADRWPSLPGMTDQVEAVDGRWPPLPSPGHAAPATERLPLGGAPWNA